MPKKTCPNGHIYDSSIYGDECPLCPKGGFSDQQFSNPQDMGGGYQESAGGGTRVTPPGGGAAPQHAMNAGFGQDAAGETQMRQPQQPGGGRYEPQPGGGTVIRQKPGMAAPKGRKLVGFLVTYNRTPQGKAYEIYEGKNYIGRDKSCDISIPNDNQVSGRHMSILYRNVDNKFKYRDEQSSNGTFVNQELSDEGELQNFDIIKLGGTVFIFLAIPQIG